MTRAPLEQIARTRQQIAADLRLLRDRWRLRRPAGWLPVGVAILAGVLAGAWAGRQRRPGRGRGV